ncbi:DUF1903-domain-containing protein [Lasiosphaeria miniovina]|uniref:Cx9C motif-containing protein 4, mitochondrial n=1 Tax=Lasiosphaeria miniovina TaxID=1954250 RepID=A0AA39ZUL5_9PEZI|nr:DUF1903-domain-containing protein [Lasiosphaeria miniovina]KAK0703825.1 DUF1903-domain-containing protein [Lasiosphaeria miniovina]
MTIEQDIRSNPPCQPRACAIQGCLTRNGFDEGKCTKFVDSLYECCQAFYANNGDHARSASCPKADLLRLRIEQRREPK